MSTTTNPIKRLLLFIRGRWRLLWGFCPACNSSAPGIDNCQICEGYRTPFPPSRADKTLWRNRYEEEYLP